MFKRRNNHYVKCPIKNCTRYLEGEIAIIKNECVNFKYSKYTMEEASEKNLR